MSAKRIDGHLRLESSGNVLGVLLSVALLHVPSVELLV